MRLWQLFEVIFPNEGVPVGGKSNLGVFVPLNVDASGNLLVSVTGAGSGGTSSSFGAAFPGAGTAAGFKSFAGSTMEPGNLDASGNLLVNVAAGSGSNPAAGATGSAVPSSADYIGLNVGGTLRGAVGFDLDSGAGTQYGLGVNLRKIASGGSVEAGTSTDPLRIDPTGTTTQPISAVALPLAPLAATTTLQTTGNTSLGAIDTNAGAQADAAVTGDNSGTLSSKLRGINKILAAVWDSGNNWLKVSLQNTTIAVTQSGSWVLSAGSAIIGKVGIDQTTPGTTNKVSIGTDGVVTLAAGSAIVGKVGIDQTTPGTTNLVAAGQNGTWTVQPGNTANTTAWKVDGSAVTQPISGTVTANAGTNLNTSALALEASLVKLPVAQGSTTAGQSGPLAQGAVTTSAPSYTTAQTSPLSLDTSGNLRATVVQSGTWTVQPGNTPNTSPWLVTVGHGKTLKTVAGSLTADTDIIAAVSSKRLKVYAYAFWTFATNADVILLKSNGAGGTLLWNVILQGTSSPATGSGANLAVAVPTFLFATVAGEKLTVDVANGDTIYYSVSYWDDDAT
jgi:hypothetical protein